MTKVYIGYVIMVALTIAAVVFLCFYNVCVSVGMYDMNLYLFKNVLTPEQANSVIHSARGMHTLTLTIAFPVFLMWTVGTLLLLRLARKASH